VSGDRLRKSIVTVACVSMAALGVAACGSGGSADNSGPIRIGALFPASGPLATLGKASLDGLKIAVDMTNSEGGVNGRPVEVVEGDASSAAAAVSEATRLTTKEGVKIVLGTYASDLALAASGAAVRNGAFYWETDAISDDLTTRGMDNFYQFPFQASANGAKAADLLKDKVAPVLGRPLKVVVVHNDSSYGSLVASGAVEQAQANGLTVLDNLAYPTDTNDQSALALKIKGDAPDAVIAASYQNDAVLLQKALEAQGVQLAAFVGTGGIYGLASFQQALGAKSNGLFDTEGSASVPDSLLTADAAALRSKFVSAWQAANPGQDPTFLPTIAFDATWTLLHAVVAAAPSTDAADLSAAADKLDLPTGSTILGYGVKFDEKGLNTRAFVVGQQWQDGKLVVVYPDEAATAGPIDVPLPSAER
jgi:branched-chain amino acid transport system substrate-binding protein